ncbi:3-oxoacyl-[acyl-carrier-protein] synthase III C-terminal domain-containing protein [Bacillus sp. NEB1478]|uniref:type III polyketide synthase n=1 Tax=Bacillus sp. NEB1478 TaxID=3073816 RepID=UPI0028731E6A|nr:3-oxoacyl-[acyl-carrier-protein] synthase III C-terminal domain-containing protein [Bacillus sp. NEB1478]WNB93673.1 3-oxoacyl-[acyl-carrier-protein] synthase III C-terminal domain-containing protein [Bacillus sp. NEB1478]
MPKIAAVETVNPPHRISQNETMEFARNLFKGAFSDIERLLKVFQNGEISSRYFVMPIDWFKEKKSFQEKNDLYIDFATNLGSECIRKCMEKSKNHNLSYEDIDAIFFISSSGLSTPSIEARIMNILPFSSHTKRIPIWGLGCAGGASGFSRANDYCIAYPKSNVLVLSVELCSLTFQHEDLSKSNLVGTSLFADGVACALICGDESSHLAEKPEIFPYILDTMSTLKPHSEDVMGWEVKDTGLYVVFSRDIPNIIRTWLEPNVNEFLERNKLNGEQITHFVAHPGGKKVLQAYVDALGLPISKTDISREVLMSNGNMSSVTVFYVLKKFMDGELTNGDLGVMAALGPGFSSELLLLEWR